MTYNFGPKRKHPSSYLNSFEPVYEIEKRFISPEEVAKNGWIIIHRKVYDFSQIEKWHPGSSLANYAGKDATEYFDSVHPISFLRDFKPVGYL